MGGVTGTGLVAASPPGAARAPLATMSRLSIRIQRFEVLAIVAFAGLIVLATVFAHVRLAGIVIPDGCWETFFRGEPLAPGQADVCTGPITAFNDLNENVIGKVMAAMAVFPFIGGLVLGIPVVGREIEARTATLAWSLGGSRRRWYAGRMTPILAVVGVTALGTALAAATLVGVRQPWTDVEPSFYDSGLYGWPVVGRAIAAFGIGVLFAAVIGRTLPALLLGGPTIVLLVISMYAVQDVWLDANTVRLDGAAIAEINDGRWSGVITDAGDGPDGQPIYHGVPGARARDWQTIEAAGLAAVGGALLLVTIPVIDRRRPT